ncbi:hypothetical protein M434DRAFT_391764 [Hypoxylon sp. CO27-5]|nr:hypothetical protein M434DRAFT_391764 [Hypoxylon sp. CO27-5]
MARDSSYLSSILLIALATSVIQLYVVDLEDEIVIHIWTNCVGGSVFLCVAVVTAGALVTALLANGMQDVATACASPLARGA